MADSIHEQKLVLFLLLHSQYMWHLTSCRIHCTKMTAWPLYKHVFYKVLKTIVLEGEIKSRWYRKHFFSTASTSLVGKLIWVGDISDILAIAVQNLHSEHVIQFTSAWLRTNLLGWSIPVAKALTTKGVQCPLFTGNGKTTGNYPKLSDFLLIPWDLGYTIVLVIPHQVF